MCLERTRDRQRPDGAALDTRHVHLGRERVPRLRVGEEHHLGFEPLGPMDVHHAHDVATPRLERQRLDVGRHVVGSHERRRHLVQSGAGHGHQPRAVGGLQQRAGLAPAGVRRRVRQPAALVEHAIDQRADRQPSRLPLPRAQLPDGARDVIVDLARPVEVEAPARLAERVEGIVGRAQDRAAEHAQEGRAVRGIGQAREHVDERVHVGRRREERRARHLDGHEARLQRLGVPAQPGPPTRQHQIVARRTRPRRDLVGNQRRDDARLGVFVLLVALRRHQQPRDGRRARRRGIAVGAQWLVGRRVGGRLGRKRTRARRVHEVAEFGPRTEVRRERHHVAARGEQALPDALVHLDVGAPEPVDRLLRVADEEQGAGAQRYRPRRVAR